MSEPAEPHLSAAGLSNFASVQPIIKGRRPEAINKTPEGTRPFTVWYNPNSPLADPPHYLR